MPDLGVKPSPGACGIVTQPFTGCGETTNLMSAHASEQVTDVACQYSGADRSYKVISGDVFEYSSPTGVQSKNVVVAKADGQVYEYH